MINKSGLAKLGIRHPIIQAPMAGVSTPELAAAVSNAGALGSIAVELSMPILRVIIDTEYTSFDGPAVQRQSVLSSTAAA